MSAEHIQSSSSSSDQSAYGCCEQQWESALAIPMQDAAPEVSTDSMPAYHLPCAD
jgi:hypothetical protein